MVDGLKDSAHGEGTVDGEHALAVARQTHAHWAAARQGKASLLLNGTELLN